jgi:hypothetical protein
MNFKTLCFTTIISSALVCQPIYAVQNNLIFKNQRGSILELSSLANNKIEGYFTTAVASKACPDAIGAKRPIIGYTVGNAMTFSVFYPMCNSVLSITGNFNKNQASLDTISILNLQANDITHEGPGARFIGHDSYKKID